MAYATSAQAIELYGEAYVIIACDRDGDGVLDTASFDKNLEIATRQMNMYLLGRYALPLATPPEHFQQICTDIAIYNAAPSADVRTKEITKRFDAAITVMEQIASNKIKLELATDTTGANATQTPTVTTKTQIQITAGDARQFNRDSFKKLY